MNKSATMTEALRAAVRESGEPLLRIAQATGVQRASLSRFVAGTTSLRLDVADKLAAHFGIRVSRGKRPKREQGA